MLFDKYLGTFIGIDFRDDSIDVSFVNNSLSGLTLLASSEFPMRNADTDIDPVREYISSHASDIRGVFACIPDRWGIVRFIEVPSTKGGDTLDQLMSFEIERHIPFGLDEVVYDYLVVDEREKVFEVVFTVIRKQKMEHFNNIMEGLSLKPGLITTTAFSALNAVDLSGSALGGWQQIAGIQGRSYFSGSRGCSVLVYSEKSYIAAYLFVDGSCRGIKSFHYGPSSSGNIVEDVKVHMANLKSKHGIESFDRVIAAGRSDILPEGLSSFQEEEGTEVLAINEMERFAAAAAESGSGSVTPSVGACLAGLKMGSYRVNLLPHKRDHQIKKKAPLTTQVLAVLIILLLVATASAEYFNGRKYLRIIEDEISRNAPEIERVGRLSASVEEYQRQRRELENIVGSEITLDMLAELTRILPKQAWITNLSYKGSGPADKKKEGAEIIISGFADSSSALIPILEDSHYFEQVEFVGPIKKAGKKEGFKIKAVVVNPETAASGKKKPPEGTGKENIRGSSEDGA